MTQRPIRVLLADDHAVVREGYRALLQSQPDIQVVAEAVDGDEAYALYRQHGPDVAVVDLSMHGRGGLEAMARIRQADPHARLLVFTMHLNASFALQAFRAGATGYVTKTSPAGMLVQAVRDVFAGRPAISPDISRELALQSLDPDGSAIRQLTPREFEIVRMRMALQSIEQIANALHVSPKTVSNTWYQAKAKLGVESDIEMVHVALRAGLIEPLTP